MESPSRTSLTKTRNRLPRSEIDTPPTGHDQGVRVANQVQAAWCLASTFLGFERRVELDCVPHVGVSDASADGASELASRLSGEPSLTLVR